MGAVRLTRLIKPDGTMQRHKHMKQTRRAAGIACLALAAAVTGCGATVTGGRAPAVPITTRPPMNSAVPYGVRCAPAQLQLSRQGSVSEATQQLTWVSGVRTGNLARRSKRLGQICGDDHPHITRSALPDEDSALRDS